MKLREVISEQDFTDAIERLNPESKFANVYEYEVGAYEVSFLKRTVTVTDASSFKTKWVGDWSNMNYNEFISKLSKKTWKSIEG